MKRRCEYCYSDDRMSVLHFGGNRPALSYHVPEVDLCHECRRVAEELLRNRIIQFRLGYRDTTNSRYSRIKAAVKRARFGRANISIKDLPTYVRES